MLGHQMALTSLALGKFIGLIFMFILLFLPDTFTVNLYYYKTGKCLEPPSILFPLNFLQYSQPANKVVSLVTIAYKARVSRPGLGKG